MLNGLYAKDHITTVVNCYKSRVTDEMKNISRAIGRIYYTCLELWLPINSHYTFTGMQHCKSEEVVLANVRKIL